MSQTAIGVVMFDGATDATSVLRAVELAGGNPVALHPKTTTAPELAAFKIVMLPGGFSYGDYLRPGALAATQPIMRLITDAVKAKELTVIGLGNGVQVLTEAGLLPGAFIANDTPGFDRGEVELVVENTVSVITNSYDAAQRIRLPYKGAYGQYTATEEQLDALEDNGNILLRSLESVTGSARDIAAISSDDGLVVGLMASPEYAIEEGFGTDHPDGPGLGVDGQGLFISVVRAAGATIGEGVVGE